MNKDSVKTRQKQSKKELRSSEITEEDVDILMSKQDQEDSFDEIEENPDVNLSDIPDLEALVEEFEDDKEELDKLYSESRGNVMTRSSEEDKIRRIKEDEFIRKAKQSRVKYEENKREPVRVIDEAALEWPAIFTQGFNMVRHTALVRNVADLSGYYLYEVDDILKAFYEVVKDHLYRGDTVYFSDMFKIGIYRNKPRKFYNSSTGLYETSIGRYNLHIGKSASTMQDLSHLNHILRDFINIFGYEASNPNHRKPRAGYGNYKNWTPEKKQAWKDAFAQRGRGVMAVLKGHEDVFTDMPNYPGDEATRQKMKEIHGEEMGTRLLPEKESEPTEFSFEGVLKFDIPEQEITDSKTK